MLSEVNCAGWIDVAGEDQEEEDIVSYASNKDEMMGSFSTFTSLLENGWLDCNNGVQNHHEIGDISFHSNYSGPENLLLQSIESSSSCSPSSVFNLDQPFLAPKPCFSSLLNSNPFESCFDLSCDLAFLPSLHASHSADLAGLVNRSTGGALTGFGVPDLSSISQFPTLTNNFSLEGPESSLFNNRTNKMLKPLEIFPCVGAQPTLFQKRKSRENNGNNKGKMELEEELVEKRKKNDEEDEIDEASMDGSGLNYDSDEAMENNKFEENLKSDMNNSNANSTITNGDQKGKKKGRLPAKNLMAERRRRKKLNDRLYMLRSVVPKISKMDRASIPGDAIEYLKELLQRINDLHNELESTPPGSSLPLTTSFHPLTPTSSTLHSRVKEEICHSALPNPNNQPARVEVRMREGRAVNIHMFCARRPGLLLSTLKALDDLGLDVQQAVISCFDGFALDVFRAEQCKDDPDILPEAIKTVLMNSASYHGVM